MKTIQIKFSLKWISLDNIFWIVSTVTRKCQTSSTPHFLENSLRQAESLFLLKIFTGNFRWCANIARVKEVDRSEADLKRLTTGHIMIRKASKQKASVQKWNWLLKPETELLSKRMKLLLISAARLTRRHVFWIKIILYSVRNRTAKPACIYTQRVRWENIYNSMMPNGWVVREENAEWREANTRPSKLS